MTSWTRIDPARLATTGGVYRIFSGEACLYVGRSRYHPVGRLLSHMSQQSWWGRATHADYTLLPGCGAPYLNGPGLARLAALETELIRDLRPEFNVAMNTEPPPPRPDDWRDGRRSPWIPYLSADGMLWRIQDIGGLSIDELSGVARALRKAP